MTFPITPFPAAALSQHIIILGKTGAGKSSTMRLLVECLLTDGKPVCIIDPKGDWWGLKSSASGKQAGFPVIIFGGDHADIPLTVHAGAYVAELVATGNRPCIVDLGGWTVGDRTRFFVDFAQALFRHTRGPRWLCIDEVHNFAPQGKIMDPQAGQMLHWANRLASEGRGKGITLLSASQRPQKVHKDYVTSHETLIAMRVIHPLDRDAIKDWIDGCPDLDKGKEVLRSLASLKRGEAWCGIRRAHSDRGACSSRCLRRTTRSRRQKMIRRQSSRVGPPSILMRSRRSSQPLSRRPRRTIRRC
jgi:DNA helicase HerA-like ATPase